MIRKFLQQIQFQKEWLAVTGFIWASLLYMWYGHTHFELQASSTLSLNQATLDGVDVGARIRFFYKVILSTVFILPVLYGMVYLLGSKWMPRERERQIPLLLSVTGLVLLLADVYGFESSRSVEFVGALLGLYIVFSLLALKKTYRQIIHPTYFSVVMVLAFLFTVMGLFLFNSNVWMYTHFNVVFVVSSLLVCLKFVFWKGRLKVLSSRLFMLAWPMSFMPLLIFFSVEALFYVKLHHQVFIPYIKWFAASISLLFLLFYLSRIWLRRHVKTGRLLSVWLVPAALISFILLSFYAPIQAPPSDLFELANASNAQLRIWKFHEVPCLDFMSSHMLSEQWFGLLYHACFGYTPTADFLVYGFLNSVLFYLLAYLFGLRFFRQPALVLLLLISFPFVANLFSESVFFTVLIFFAVQRLLKNQRWQNYLYVFLLVALLMCWRLDAGSAALWAALVSIPLFFLSDQKRIDFMQVIKGLGVFLCLLFLSVLFFMFWRSPVQILSALQNALHYLSANQAHGYALLSHEMNQQFYFFYVMIPLLSLCLIAFILYIKRSRQATITSHDAFILHAAMFFYVIVLVNFQRGLVRHGFMEYNDSYLASTFYLATALLLMYFVSSRLSAWRYLSFFCVSFFLMVTLTYFPIAKGKTELERFLSDMSLRDLSLRIHNPALKGRIQYAGEATQTTYQDFDKFLNTHLSPDQTFLDFANSPMLYTYFQRRVPSYFCQSLQNTADDFTQKEQLKQLNSSNVPVVVFSNDPPDWYDATDGVPNVMRYPYLAEYIFSHYQPYAVIDKKSIWIGKQLNWSDSGHQKDTLINKPQTFAYRKAALLIDRYYAGQSSSVLKSIYETMPVLDSLQRPCVLLPDRLCRLPSVYVRIHLQDIGEREVKLSLLDHEFCFGRFTFETRNGEHDYMIRLSNVYGWFQASSATLQFDDIQQPSLGKVQFYTATN